MAPYMVRVDLLLGTNSQDDSTSIPFLNLLYQIIDHGSILIVLILVIVSHSCFHVPWIYEFIHI